MKKYSSEEMELAVEIQKEMNPEGIENLEKMFGVYIQKTILLTDQFSKNEVNKDDVAKEVQKFLITIKNQMVGNWSMVETYQTIIKKLEEHIVTTGGDLNAVRNSVFN